MADSDSVVTVQTNDANPMMISAKPILIKHYIISYSSHRKIQKSGDWLKSKMLEIINLKRNSTNALPQTYFSVEAFNI
jgi:hypothetical protein